MADDTKRVLAALENAINRLAAADEDGDEDAIWEASRDALGWLYRADNYLHTNDDEYRGRRDADENGQTLAGLIWIRGKVDHREGIDLHKGTGAGPASTVHLVGADGKPQPVTIQVVGFPGPATVHIIEGGRWSRLHQLPRHRPEAAATFYAERVEGRKLLHPIREANAYLTAASLTAPGVP